MVTFYTFTYSYIYIYDSEITSRVVVTVIAPIVTKRQLAAVQISKYRWVAQKKPTKASTHIMTPNSSYGGSLHITLSVLNTYLICIGPESSTAMSYMLMFCPDMNILEQP